MTTKKEAASKKPVAKKATRKTAAAEKKAHSHDVTGSYFYAVGRRKSGIAQVRVYLTGKGKITVNRKPMTEYFPVAELQDAILLPLKAAGIEIDDKPGGLTQWRRA